MYWLDRSGNQRCPWSPYAARSCQDNCPHQSAHFVHQRSAARTIQVSADHSIRYRTKRKAHCMLAIQSTLQTAHGPKGVSHKAEAGSVCTHLSGHTLHTLNTVHTLHTLHTVHTVRCSAHIARIAAAPTLPKMLHTAAHFSLLHAQTEKTKSPEL